MSNRPNAQGIDGLRRDNLSWILTAVHRERRISRAEITRQSGLTRSGVKVLVEALVELGVVDEVAPGNTARSGRPSPILVPREDVIVVALNCDRRGITAAFATLGARIVHRAERAFEGERGAREAARMVADIIVEARASLPEGATVVGIGAAVPGLVVDGAVHAPSIGWVGEPFAEYLAAETGLPAEAAFDAHLGLAAESIWGAAAGCADVVYLYGGPGGVGAAAMAGGRLVTGVVGMAAVLAHFTVNPGGVECNCGARGCFGAEVTDANVRAAIAAADESGGEADLAHELDMLAALLRSTVVAYDPELVLFDGFLAPLLERGGERLASATDTMPQRPIARRTRLGEATLHPDRLLVGAADLAFAPLLADPGLLAEHRRA